MTEEQVNTYAAFQFLREMRERREREEGEEEGGGEGVVFRKPRRGKKKGEEGGEGELSRSGEKGGKRTVLSGAGVGAGVIKMAEYVVGGDRKRKRKQLQVTGEDQDKDRATVSKVKKTSCVSLSHLEEEIEE